MSGQLNNNQHRLLPVLALLAATGMWGSTFAMQKDLLVRINIFDFLGLRFAMAGIVAAIIFWPHLRRAGRDAWKYGAILGVLYTAGQELQTLGLQFTSASVTGFLTGMYVVLTPVVAYLFFRVRQNPRLWFAVVLATVGLATMSLNGFSLGWGETLVLCSAAVYAIHVVLIERFVKRTDPIVLTAVQMIVLGALSMLAALPGGVQIPHGDLAVRDWAVIAYMAIFSGIGSLLLQTWAQARMSATRAAIVMTSEPVWAAFFAVVLIHEVLTPRVVLGGTLIVGAMLVSQLDLPWLRSRRE
ncbi:MAG: DMT family transporter [Actinomycetaceae bacterium]|nr:DMT family transporter [Actinomycetaceae bacterium]MDY5854566.1 DMT family transporter [Arcanobacterium sp.]